MVAPSEKRSRQRGFSLIVVFLIILVMVTIASAVMLGTQGDLQVAGHDREHATALYSAEAAVTWAEWLLYRYPTATPGLGAWTSLLSSTTGAVTQALCVNIRGLPQTNPPLQLQPLAAQTYTPGPNAPPPPAGPPIVFDAARGASFQWCVHNNALDPYYHGKALPVGCATSNMCDGDNILTIEAYGYGPNGANVHLSVDVSYYNPPTGRVQDYQQGGGGGSKANAASGEADPAAMANSVTRNF